ncbi:hypothetical protein O6H91_Y126200 [Diphasiastrum complanatum]|nr:hypothetical protein O6H91_Y126200 [Diphasiastrum complanatum]
MVTRALLCSWCVAGGGASHLALRTATRLASPRIAHLCTRAVVARPPQGGSHEQQQQQGQGQAKVQAAQEQKQKLNEGVTPRSQDFSKWYLDVIAWAELADYGPVRGTMVIRPYGYAIWEFIQSWLDAKFKETGHSNMYFPQLIPYSFIEKEASHVEGFSPELALVTIGGGKELEEKLVVRPTSETIVNHMFAQWVQSHRDLPLLVNQWANVTRWEMRTRPFIRTLEFLWQEGHTAHATKQEAEEEALQMIEVYRTFAVDQAAIPVVVGRKSKLETFAGAVHTYTIEAMMGDRKALQAGTSHNLGQNFARAFETKFTDENGASQYVWQTSWGMSTRMIGGIIMTHGDDRGLILPPKVAPIQVVIVPIWKSSEEKESVLGGALAVEKSLKAASIRVKLDASEQKTPGWKFNHWEMKVGVPLRVEIGPRDITSGSVVTVRRDFSGKASKEFGVSLAGLDVHIRKRLEEIQDNLLARALTFQDENIVDVESYLELKAAVSEGKWGRGHWAGSDLDEVTVKEETGATIRCFPFNQPEASKPCFMTGKSANEVAIFAKSY